MTATSAARPGTTPAAASSAISRTENPAPNSTSRECSPGSGAGYRTAVGVSLKCSGLPTAAVRPSRGCSNDTSMLLWRTCGWATTSGYVAIGPHMMSAASSTDTHSADVLVRKIGISVSRSAARCRTRSRFDLNRASAAMSGRPSTSHNRVQRSGVYAATMTNPSRVGSASFGAAYAAPLPVRPGGSPDARYIASGTV